MKENCPVPNNLNFIPNLMSSPKDCLELVGELDICALGKFQNPGKQGLGWCFVFLQDRGDKALGGCLYMWEKNVFSSKFMCQKVNH